MNKILNTSLALVMGALASTLTSEAINATNLSALKQEYSVQTAVQLRELADALAGGVGVTADPVAALTLYQEAADNGDAEAAFSAGYRLLIGVSVTADMKRASKYLNLAASQNHGGAMLWAGLISEQRKELGDALGWYRQAAAANVSGSYDRLAELLILMPVTDENLATLHALVTQGVDLDKEVQNQVLSKNYLGILGDADARFLQTKLTEAGFDTEGIDGSIGPKSRKALAAFRSSRGRASAPNLVLSILDLKDLGFF